MKYKLLVGLLIGVGLMACRPDGRDERPVPEPDQAAALSMQGGESDGNQLISLEQLRANPNLTEIAAPAGFVPAMQGVWIYESVYLFQVNGTSEIIEAYTFDDPVNQAPAAAICNRRLRSDGACVKSGTQCYKEGNTIICCA